MEIAVEAGANLRLFIDLNETLIRTGEVSLEDQLRETAELGEFVASIGKLATELAGLDVVFLTGNSFEYSRRIEEPMGLKNLPGVSVLIISENGLIGRSFVDGDLWRLAPTDDYRRCLDAFDDALGAAPETRGRFYTQGNEVRRTLKPVANAFTESERATLAEIARATLPESVGTVFVHRYYVDIDPVRVIEDGRETVFGGKSFAVERIHSRRPAVSLAVGDSSSDVPMFDAVNATGGHSFWVANAEPPGRYDGARRLTRSFTAGVNEMLARIRVGRRVD